MKLLDQPQLKKIIYKDKSKSYTYGLVRDDGSLLYVGVGIRNRVLQHTMKTNIEKDSNKLKVNTIKKQAQVRFVIFVVHSDRNFCLGIEQKLISRYGRIDTGTGILCNLTDGGEVGPVGVKVKEQTRVKLRAARALAQEHLSLKSKEWWDGKSADEKQEQISRMRSNTQTPEAKQKRADEHRRKWADPIFREKMLESQRKARQNKLSQSIKE